MTERKGQQPRQAPVRVQARAGKRVAVRKRPESDNLDELRQQRDQLARELQAARAEIARLRAAQDDVINRIDWIIDSLNSLPESDS